MISCVLLGLCAYQVVADTSGNAAVNNYQQAQTTGYEVPEFYNEIGSGSGYSTGSEYNSGYGVASSDIGGGLPAWLLPTLLIVCGLALLIPSMTVIETPPLDNDRKKRNVADTTNFSLLREMVQLFNNKDCILRVGCEMLEVEGTGKYKALAVAFSPLSSMYGSYYTEELCSKLNCPIRVADDYFSNHL